MTDTKQIQLKDIEWMLSVLPKRDLWYIDSLNEHRFVAIDELIPKPGDILYPFIGHIK